MSLVTSMPAKPFTTTDALGHPVSLADYRGKLTLLAFFRYTGCPLCNIRFWLLSEHYKQLHEHGLNIVAIFQSSAADVKKFAETRQAPFPVIADPERKLYRLYGIGTSWFGFLKGFIVRGGDYRTARQRGLALWTINGRMDQMPAEFLIAPDLTIATAHYGTDMGDFLSLETIESFMAHYSPASVHALHRD